MKIYLSFLLLIFFISPLLVYGGGKLSHYSYYYNDFYSISEKKDMEFENRRELKSNMNIKMVPSFFWKTIGIEYEYVVHKYFTLGLNGRYKFGRTDGENNPFKINPDKHFQAGFGLDLIGKFYMKGLAAEGLYFALMGSYSNIVYKTGHSKPFSLFQRSRDRNNENILFKPKPWSGGIGIGYQFPLIEKYRIAGNILLSAQGQKSESEDFFISVFLRPSVGYMF